MPAFRNVRRSRRLSRQPPRDPASDELDLYDHELMYPDDGAAPSSATTTLDAHLPPPDETGEPEIDAESSALSPGKLVIHPSQRSSHSRKKKPGHIPRPPNAFMIFRSELWNKEKIKSDVERDHRQISRIAGSLWNSLSDAERVPYQLLADEAKKEHARLYPEYKYSPIYRRDKPAKRKPKHDHADKVTRCNEVARLMQLGYEGDELKRELERRHAGREDDHFSDASDYVDAPRRKKGARQPIKRSSVRTRHRRVKVKDDDEYVPDLPARDTVIKKEESESPVIAQPHSPPVDEPEAFVPTSEIPPLDLGEACLSEEIKFTNPFASPEGSPESLLDTTFSSPGSGSLSDEFLASSGEEPRLRSSSPPGDYCGIFVAEAGQPLQNGGSFDPFADPDAASEHPYYAHGHPGDPMYAQQFVDVDFSEWMKYEE